MGRSPKPTKTKELEGEKPSRMPKAGPKPAAELPPPPEFLDAVGRNAWERLAAVLGSMNLVTAADWDALALYATSYSRWIAANELVELDGLTIETGQGYKAHPALQIAANAQRSMLTLMGKLGLTPAARAALHVADDAGPDELLGFLHPSTD